MRKLGVILLVGVLIGGVGSIRAQAQVDEMESASSLYYYSGSFTPKQQVEFNLQLKGFAVSGSYIIEASGDMYVFSGRMALDRQGIGVLVYDGENNYVASIEAKFISEESNFGKLLKGNWKSADGRTSKTINLRKVAEFAEAESTESDYTYQASYGE